MGCRNGVKNKFPSECRMCRREELILSRRLGFDVY